MNITSSYQVRIVNCSVSLDDTVCVFLFVFFFLIFYVFVKWQTLSYLIGGGNEKWGAGGGGTTGALEQQHYIEKLVTLVSL